MFDALGPVRTKVTINTATFLRQTLETRFNVYMLRHSKYKLCKWTDSETDMVHAMWYKLGGGGLILMKKLMSLCVFQIQSFTTGSCDLTYLRCNAILSLIFHASLHMMAFNPVYGYLVYKHSRMISMLLLEYLHPTATQFNDGCR